MTVTRTLLALAAIMVFAGPAGAQSTFSWNGSTITGSYYLWSTAANWDLVAGAGTPPPVAGDTAIWGTSSQTMTLDADQTVATVNASGTWTLGLGDPGLKTLTVTDSFNTAGLVLGTVWHTLSIPDLPAAPDVVIGSGQQLRFRADQTA